MKIVIPARMGSKGLPFKNRQLFNKTADTIPEDKTSSVWVTTDDPVIADMAKDRGFNVINRPEYLADDVTPIRDVLAHSIGYVASNSDLIVMLYLTYPERTWADIQEAMAFFLTYYQLGISDSMLCKKEIKSHPYLMMYEKGVDGIFGDQIVRHDLCRRQDYPTCFEISHFVSIFKAGSIFKLNRNLYCDSTVFFPIRDVIDVDLEEHLVKIIDA